MNGSSGKVQQITRLQHELMHRPADPFLGLHAVFSCQGHSGVVEAPVFLSLQLQDENLDIIIMGR